MGRLSFTFCVDPHSANYGSVYYMCYLLLLLSTVRILIAIFLLAISFSCPLITTAFPVPNNALLCGFSGVPDSVTEPAASFPQFELHTDTSHSSLDPFRVT